MIYFFQVPNKKIIALEVNGELDSQTTGKLEWLFGKAVCLSENRVDGWFVGPRKEMITPWSTNAVEITQNMGVEGLKRIEEFFVVKGKEASFDPMLQVLYEGLDQKLFTIKRSP